LGLCFSDHILSFSTCSSALETDLKIEREWRAALQSNLEQEKEIVSQLNVEIQKLRAVNKVSGHNLRGLKCLL
jgi:hypothetical protein